MNSEQTRGKIALIASMAIFGSIGLFRRYILLSSSALAMLRGLIGAAFLLLFMLARQQKPDKAAIRTNLALLLVSGVLIGSNWIMLFEAYNYTTVATATLCYYMAPVFIALAAPLVLKEKLTAKKLLCVAVALVGVALVSGVLTAGFSAGELKGVLLGLAAAVLYACVTLINKRLKPIDAYDKTLVQLATAGVVLLPYVLLTRGFADAQWTTATIFLTAIVGIIHTGIAFALYFGSIGILPAQTLAIFSYIDPIVAVILGALLLHEPMGLGGWIGAVLILGAAIVSDLPGKKE